MSATLDLANQTPGCLDFADLHHLAFEEVQSGDFAGLEISEAECQEAWLMRSL